MSLSGRVCIVTGATRGIGKGIALQLGEAGATVYITGRTLKSKPGSHGSLEETSQEIEKRGGKCIPVQCDHTKDEDIEAVFTKVKEEQNGRLDLLVNNAFSAAGVLMDNISKKFYEMPATVWDDVNNVGLRNHYICTVHASRMMVEQGSGLIVYISHPGGLRYFLSVVDGVGKAAVDRLATDCGFELYEKNVSCVSLWPGMVKTERILGAAEKDVAWESDTMKSTVNLKEATMERGESPEFSGKVIVALMKENDKQRMKRSGRVHIIADIADEYGIKDIDGKRPYSLRSLAGICKMTGYNKLAWCFPRWMKIPKWILTLSGSRF